VNLFAKISKFPQIVLLLIPSKTVLMFFNGLERLSKKLQIFLFISELMLTFAAKFREKSE
jgi:hypothetical protein